jgi:hypothetical protein
MTVSFNRNGLHFKKITFKILNGYDASVFDYQCQYTFVKTKRKLDINGNETMTKTKETTIMIHGNHSNT